MATTRRSKKAAFESLESRTMLAGDLISHWVADDLLGQASISDWVDRIDALEIDAFGSPQVLPDRFGGRATLQLDPSDEADFFRLNPNQNPLPTGEFSIAVAFSVTGAIAGDSGHWFTNTGLVDANLLGLGQDWGISLAPGGQISVGTGGGFGATPTTLYSDRAGLNDGQMHVAVFTRSDSTLSIFIDGELSGTRNDASTAARTQRDVTFGILQNNKNPLHGELGQVRFYDGALSLSEAQTQSASILAYYNNSPPVAVDDAYSLAEDSVIFFVPADQGVLQNDTDVDGDPFSAELVDAPSHGGLALSPDGSITYAPSPDFFGTDHFTYRVFNEQQSNVATVTLTVNNVYDPVNAYPDEYKLQPHQVLQVNRANGVLANDVNPDQAELSVELVTPPVAGSVTLRSDGSFDYDPQGFAGRDHFTYRVLDGVGSSNPVEVTLLVNTPPQARPDSFETLEDQPLVLSANAGVLQNDTDADNDSLTARAVSEPTHGTLLVRPDGSLEYQPDADYFGTDTFFYQASDGIDDSSIAFASIQIRPVNDAPSAEDNLYYLARGQQLDVVDSSSGVLGNDTDIDSAEALTARLVDPPSNGTLNLLPNGTFSYVPRADFEGIDSFTYRAHDGQSDSELATVQFFVDTSPVRISEVMTANVDGLVTNVRDSVDDRFSSREEFTPDWIEIQNLAAGDFDLGGFFLSDNDGNSVKWQVPVGTVIPAGGYLVVFASGRDVTNVDLDENGLLHTNFSLNIRNEEVILAFPDGRIADEIAPRIHFPNTSYGIDGNGTLGLLSTATPGTPNTVGTLRLLKPVTFSVERGMFDAPFDVEIFSHDPDTQIRYTTDGSAPTATTGTVYTGPIRVESTSTLRASAFANESLPGDVITHTYLFLNDVIQQEEQPAGYPSSWAGMPASYGMDPDVVGESNLFNDLYRNTIADDLKSLPTLSLVFDANDIFGNRGIYQNPLLSGDNSERATSVEFFDPLGSEPGFHLNSGIRIMGGSSRQPDIPKHSFRLEFREQYGWGSLEYPMYEDVPYGDGAVASFDELVIRTGFNNSWMHRHYYQGERGEQPRDQWVRDLQFAMGQPSSRGRFVHVYLNGMYWGIYNIQERPAAPFMADYFGGNAETDWDVINSGQAIDGTSASWNSLHRLARDADEPEVFEQLKSEIDMVNLADYMLLNFYIGNTDWDGHNWIAAKQAGEPYRMFAWDSEFAISLPPSNTAIGDNAERQIINVNRTNQNSSNNPSGLHRLLLRNDEYRMLFADRVQKHLFNDGVLTPERATDIFLVRSAEVDRAVVAESARWGDFRRDVNAGQWNSNQFDLFTRDEHYLAQKDFIVNRYLPVRSGIVLSQLRSGNQFPDLDAPVFSQHGGRVDKEYQLTILNPEGDAIYYTLNGTDPRLSGGSIHPDASRYDGPITITDNLTVRARRLANNEWSALTEASFQASTLASPDNLRISELHYHPVDPTPEELAAGIDDADEFEFIELINTSSETIDLSEVRFVRQDDNQGIEFRFAEGPVQQLEPGQRVVVVENVAAFQTRYGESILIAGQWSGGLGNGGERLTLVAGDITIHEFSYDDRWYPTTDGNGASLEVVNPATPDLTAWERASGWRASFTEGGSPGRADRTPGDVNGDGVFNSRDLILVFQASEYEDETPLNSTFEEGDWNGDGEFDTSDLVLVFQLGIYSAAAKAIFESTIHPGLLVAARDADELFADEQTVETLVPEL